MNFSCTDSLGVGFLWPDAWARSATMSRKWFEGSRGCSLGDLYQPPEVVGSVDNSSGRASWRCSSWNWANAVKPLPRHDHFAKWKLFSNFLKNFIKFHKNHPSKKWSKNDQKMTKKRPPKKSKKHHFHFYILPRYPQNWHIGKGGGSNPVPRVDGIISTPKITKSTIFRPTCGGFFLTFCLLKFRRPLRHVFFYVFRQNYDLTPFAAAAIGGFFKTVYNCTKAFLPIFP